MKPDRTHTKTGVELSQLFVGNDGILSTIFKDNEYGVSGGMTIPSGDGFLCIRK